MDEDKVLTKMQETLALLKAMRNDERSEQNRRLAIVITEQEKVLAYYFTFVNMSPGG
jgi:hypothetical protein